MLFRSVQVPSKFNFTTFLKNGRVPSGSWKKYALTKVCSKDKSWNKAIEERKRAERNVSDESASEDPEARVRVSVGIPRYEEVSDLSENSSAAEISAAESKKTKKSRKVIIIFTYPTTLGWRRKAEV